MKKINVGIIGTGNIGTDLLVKVQRSLILNCNIFMGRNIESAGMIFAKSRGINITDRSIHALEENPTLCDIVFDATSAKMHAIHAPILKKLNKFTLDLTPAKVGSFCVPALNLTEGISVPNVNMITCGGQASVPIAYAISHVQPNIKYIEIVATIASKSAGIGTRENIDEFTQTTKEALSYFTGVKHTKAIILLNPAEPPVIMKNTIYAQVDDPDMEKVTKSVNNMVAAIQKYVLGYKLLVEPIYDGTKIITTVEILGQGDYLPPYAGNLDIITCTAVKVAEAYAVKLLGKE